VHIIGFIMTPKIDEKTGEEICDVFMVNSVDINGLVPKWLINMNSKSVPKNWFKGYEKGCNQFLEEKKKRELEAKDENQLL